MTDIIQISTATETKEDAERIAELVVQQRLAACAQVSGPIVSRYWWKGKIESSEEWVCTIKTLGQLFERAEKAIRQTHPYDVPEILATRVEMGSADYVDWVKNQVANPGS